MRKDLFILLGSYLARQETWSDFDVLHNVPQLVIGSVEFLNAVGRQYLFR